MWFPPSLRTTPECSPDDTTPPHGGTGLEPGRKTRAANSTRVRLGSKAEVAQTPARVRISPISRPLLGDQPCGSNASTTSTPNCARTKPRASLTSVIVLQSAARGVASARRPARSVTQTRPIRTASTRAGDPVQRLGTHWRTDRRSPSGCNRPISGWCLFRGERHGSPSTQCDQDARRAPRTADPSLPVPSRFFSPIPIPM
jgi:hypothetical protein